MKDPTIYDVPTPEEVEEMERLPAICTCRGNNDCDGSCQCPPPSETQAETNLANLAGELELRDNIEKQLRLRIEQLESVVSTKPTGCEPCSWPACGCQNSPTPHIPTPAQAALTWEPEAGPDASCHYDHTSAATPFGTYRIEWKSWKDYPQYCVEFESHFVTVESKLEDAKDVAQNDFNKRLRACSLPSTDQAGG